MDNNKLVTVGQLKTVAEKLKQLIDGKPDNESNPEFTTVTIGGVTIYTDLDGQIKYTDSEDNTHTFVIDDNTQQTSSMDTIVVDKICDYATNPSGDIRTVYSLPGSTAAARLASLNDNNHGGGVILTTKHRSYSLNTQTISSGSSRTILINPYTYYRVICEHGSGVALSFQNDPSSTCDEWWVDISLGTPTVTPSVTPSASAPDPVNVTIYRTFAWVNGEPNFAELQNKRVRIHVLYDIATYEVIG